MSAHLASPVFVMRHGKTDMNAAGIIQGRQDAALTVEGRATVEGHAAFLSALSLSGWRVLSGPLKRTRDSAAIVAATLGAQVELLDALEEIGRGLLEGHAKAALPPELDLAYRSFQADPWHVRPPGEGGECFEDVKRRLADRAVPRILAVAADGPVAIVTHGSVGKILVTLLCDLAPDLVARVPGKHAILHRITPGTTGPTLDVLDGSARYASLDWMSRVPAESPEA